MLNHVGVELFTDCGVLFLRLGRLLLALLLCVIQLLDFVGGVVQQLGGEVVGLNFGEEAARGHGVLFGSGSGHNFSPLGFLPFFLFQEIISLDYIIDYTRNFWICQEKLFLFLGFGLVFFPLDTYYYSRIFWNCKSFLQGD
nr:MAG TPA: hypothetical protein [Caudoviricetes sp.]